MKRYIFNFVVLTGLFLARDVQAQGMIYLSNLDQASTGGVAVGNNSWQATHFLTGNNIGGYLFDSIQVGMADASGNPNGFMVMIYTEGGVSAPAPGNWLATLDGSTDPSTAGTYTYTAGSNITLSPDTSYFIVLTAGTAIADGAYEWNYTGSYFSDAIDDWSGNGNTFFASRDGSFWHSGTNRGAEYAITAIPVPEPSSAWLLLAGGGILFYVRKLRST